MEDESMKGKIFFRHRTNGTRNNYMSKRIDTMCTFERQHNTLRHAQKTSSLGTMDND